MPVKCYQLLDADHTIYLCFSLLPVITVLLIHLYMVFWVFFFTMKKINPAIIFSSPLYTKKPPKN